jgi:hypothetical protein
MKLEETIFEIWKSDSERKGLNPQFKPLYVKFVGTEDPNNYNNILATLSDFHEKYKSISVLFENEIPFNPNLDFLRNIKQDLSSMNLYNLSQEEITMFTIPQLNTIFLKALEDVVNSARMKEQFPNKSIEINFISRLLLTVYNYIFNLDYTLGITPKCILYGKLEKHDSYFLDLLHKMDFDVIYINPYEDTQFLPNAELIKNTIIPDNKTFIQRVKSGTVINVIKSNTLKYEQELETQFFTNGVYKPWQFKDGYTKALFFNSSLIDILHNWKEPAKVRDGFEVNNKTVTVPHFFFEIEGEHKNENEYIDFVLNLQNESVENFYVINFNSHNDFIKNINNEEEKFEISFGIRNDGTIDNKTFKALKFYSWDAYNDSTEDFILNKINELIQSKTINNNFNKKEIIDLSYHILKMNDKFVEMIDSFDFVNNIPKLIVFLEDKKSLDEQSCTIIDFLNIVGFDIIILSPAGMSNISSYINKSKYNTIRLDKIVYNQKIINKRKSFFSKLFG